MPRDSSGTFSRTSGQPVVANTPISSATFNTYTADVATEITDSLSRSGKGGILAPLLFTGIAATIKGAIADGASAVAVILDNVGALANAAAKLLSIRNNGVEKLYVDKDGAIFPGASATADLTLGTDWTAFAGGTVYKSARVVTVSATIIASAPGASAAAIATLPAGFRPAVAIAHMPAIILDGGANYLGQVSIGTDGVIGITGIHDHDPAAGLYSLDVGINDGAYINATFVT
jgi:hypothetical protein